MDEIECARLMGMKQSEVVEVVPVDDGQAVRTHDGQWTLIRDDGTLRPGEAPLVAERDHGTAADGFVNGVDGPGDSGEESAAVARSVPKRRGRS